MKRHLPKRTLPAALVALLVLGSVATASATTHSFTRWKYACLDGYIEVVPSIPQKVYVWEDLSLDSHGANEFGAGFASAQPLAAAVGWCRSSTNDLAMEKCVRIARMFGSTATYWFETTASHYKSVYTVYMGANGDTHSMRPWTNTPLASRTAGWSGSCGNSGPIR